MDTTIFQPCDGHESGTKAFRTDLPARIGLPEGWSATLSFYREGVMLSVRRPGKPKRPSLSSMAVGPHQSTFASYLFAPWECFPADGEVGIEDAAEAAIREMLPLEIL